MSKLIEGLDYGVPGEPNSTKQWTKGKLQAKTAVDFQFMIRLEAADDDGICTCCTCGKRLPWNVDKGSGKEGMDAGHFLAGRTAGVLFDERGCHPQCVSCNQHKGGNQEAYTAFMLERYGQAVIDELKQQRREARIIRRFELLEMRAEYKKRIKTAKARLEQS